MYELRTLRSDDEYRFLRCSDFAPKMSRFHSSPKRGVLQPADLSLHLETLYYHSHNIHYFIQKKIYMMLRVYFRIFHLSEGSSRRLICLFTSSSKDTSGTKRAGRGPVALRMAVRMSICDSLGGGGQGVGNIKGKTSK